MQKLLIRVFDLVFATIGLLLALPVIFMLLLAGYLDNRSPLFFQQRVGRRLRPFTLVKFRTMKCDTESVGTHLVDAASITHLGKILRSTKLDELPQLFNVLIGSMSLVGPRPCLYNQTELIAERDARGVYEARPGITGLAQISGVDMSTPRKLARYDSLMLQRLDLGLYFRLLLATAFGRGRGDRVRHA